MKVWTLQLLMENRMIKGVITFLILLVLFYSGIETFRALTRKEKWHTTKTVAYAFALTLFTLTFIILFVALF